jgi:coenzyme F420-reducing hydrogenase delta subunit
MFILRAFSRGADGVIVCGCHPGDCHYATGNYHTRRRMDLLFGLMEFMGMERGRLRLEWVSAAEGARFASVMDEFAASVEGLGKNKRFMDTEISIDSIEILGGAADDE